MVLAASDALSLTNTSISQSDSADLQTEISLAESRIRSASGFGLFSISYDATIIGNPGVDPRGTVDLPTQQLSFYNAFVAAGYVVGLDTGTGLWFISWAAQGAENLVAIYSFRTSLDPSVIITNTINAISGYFTALVPIVHVRTTYNGGIDETAFGAGASTFYEFTTVADQGTDITNHSTALKAFLISQGLGYNSGNCNVYQMVT